MVLDLRLPDMSGFEVLERFRDTPALSDLPVVVFTGKELSPEEDARLHTLARSVVVKGVESPERLLDETALFLHRVVADLPPEKQRMLDRLHHSDDALVGKKVLVVDDDVRNIFALSSVLERRGMTVLTAGTGREAIANSGVDSGRGHRADGHHDAGDGWLRDHAGDPAERLVPAPAHHRADRESHEGRSRKVPGSGRVGVSGEAREYRAIAFGAADVAAPVVLIDCGDPLTSDRARRETNESRTSKVNILMVDDQPAKLLSYEVILTELGENLIKATSAKEASKILLKTDIAVVLMDVSMPELDGLNWPR